MLQGRPYHSITSGENDTLHQLSDMIITSVSQIGESIAASLTCSGAIAYVVQTCAPSQNQAIHPIGNVSRLTENAHINIILKSDREPIIFRGNNTDINTVTEWVELMESYIRKQKYDVTLQTEGVTRRLMGKARCGLDRLDKQPFT